MSGCRQAQGRLQVPELDAYPLEAGDVHMANEKEITLTHSVRVFILAYPGTPSKMLSWSRSDNNHLGAGTVVKVGNPVTMIYDHRDQDALPFTLDEEECYLLAQEIESGAPFIRR